MPRPVLWSTALAIWRERPWLGIGPDNFRHVYGRHLGMTSWDPRVHATSSYVEVLAGMGLAGAAALAWLALAALRGMARVLRDAADAHWPTTAAALAACGAIAVHALVDSFLTFTATYVVFAIAAGLLFPPAAASEASCA
jgi:O-antigen ligase